MQPFRVEIIKSIFDRIMKTSLSDRWFSWLERHSAASSQMNVRTFCEKCLPELVADGFECPKRHYTRWWADLQEALAMGLEPLEEVSPSSGGPPIAVMSLEHLLNLVWRPLIKYVSDLNGQDEAPWSETLEAHQAAVCLEMEGIVPSPSEHLSMDEWVEYLQQTLLRFAEVEVPIGLVAAVANKVAPFQLSPTRRNALHLLRSSLCSELVGPSIAKQVNRKVLAEIAEVPVPMLSEASLNLGAKQDLVALLERVHCKPDDEGLEHDEQPRPKRRRTQEALKDMSCAKMKQALYALEQRMSFRRASDTILEAQELIHRLTNGASSDGDPDSKEQLQDLLVSRHNLTRHILRLDGAVDRLSADKFLEVRENGRFAGVALATDESPPSQPRFRGLRFQITVMYFGTFDPLADWERSPGPPISCTSILGDLMHCPGKKGVDVSRIIDRQLARLGLNAFDVVAATGDGGGENEGSQSIHAHFENLNPGYVRHRCLPHIAWRTADMAIRASGLDYKNLAAYLVEGITWSRLREIATRSPADGGLALFRDGSRACKDLFGTSPAAIATTRPDTDLRFLKFLFGKEASLHRLATKDLEQRTSLGAETTRAILNLGDIKMRIQRAILAEILHRCMFLLYWTAKNSKIAGKTSWDLLLEKGCHAILDLEITPEVLQRLGTTEDEVLEPRPATWVELTVLLVVGDRDLVVERLAEALDFHRSVSDQAAAHLKLVGQNTFRTPWLTAKLLASDSDIAQEAAKALVRQLVTTRPSNRTQFEKHLLETPCLWKDLEDFSQAEPPTLLWRNNGQFETLFRFLAPRFLLCPDHVLDAERIHARWQWACTIKRGIKMHTLNACLRLTHYLENNQAFPSHEDLWEHLLAEGAQHRMSLEAIEDEGEIAMGWRSEFVFRERLGLSGSDIRLVGEAAPPPAVPLAGGTAFQVAWRNYVKTVFKKGFMYKLSLCPSVIIYVSENKTLAGREDREYEGEASGRKVAFVFFEAAPGPGGLVQRVNRETLALTPELLTIAELLQTCGFTLPPDPDRSAATAELLMEAHYQNLEVQRFVCTVEPGAPQVHMYSLDEGENAEAVLAVELPPEHRTKMVLARCLQRQVALGAGETLQAAWSTTLTNLQGRAAPFLPVPPVPPAGRGGGRGGRGRARGRGR